MSKITEHPDFPTLSRIPSYRDVGAKPAIERLFRTIDAAGIADRVAALTSEGR